MALTAVARSSKAFGVDNGGNAWLGFDSYGAPVGARHRGGHGRLQRATAKAWVASVILGDDVARSPKLAMMVYFFG